MMNAIKRLGKGTPAWDPRALPQNGRPKTTIAQLGPTHSHGLDNTGWLVTHTFPPGPTSLQQQPCIHSSLTHAEYRQGVRKFLPQLNQQQLSKTHPTVGTPIPQHSKQ